MAALTERDRHPDGTVEFTMFETPLIGRMLPGFEGLNHRLVATILGMEKNAERYREKRRWNTKFGDLFESTFDFFEQDYEDVRELRALCLDTLFTSVARINADMWNAAEVPVDRLQARVESWFHVTRDGGRHGLHKHGNHSWSGVYFVKRGDAGEPDDRNGYLRLYDPRPNITMFQDMATSPFGQTSIDIEPQEGKLVLFPSWLQHEVLDYRGQEPRITVAFNASIRLEAHP